jgi:hypothetical protein
MKFILTAGLFSAEELCSVGHLISGFVYAPTADDGIATVV